MSIRKGEDVIAGASIGFIGKPAWSQAVAVSATDLNAGYTVPADGIIVGTFVSAIGAGKKYLFVNNIAVSTAYNNSDWATFGNCQIQVNKGDVVKVQLPIDGHELSFVPFEYSGVSDINVITPEYIRNQNILSDWEEITISTSSGSPTVIQYDGFIAMQKRPADDNAIFVNNVRIQEAVFTSTISACSTMICPVKKGDSVFVFSNGPGYATTTVSHARFYKLRDYTGR